MKCDLLWTFLAESIHCFIILMMGILCHGVMFTSHLDAANIMRRNESQETRCF